MIDLSLAHEKIIDTRGHIKDLAENTQIKAVTEIFSKKGSIRANHYHKLTEQYNYIAYGSLVLATRSDSGSDIETAEFGSGSFFLIETCEHHALRFVEDTLLIVFTIGPRAGKEYETDTYRLKECMFNNVR